MPTRRSVAVAMPKKMAPITIISSDEGRQQVGQQRMRFLQLVAMLSPPQCGRQMQAISTVRLKKHREDEARNEPGEIELRTEVSVITP